MVPRAIVLDRLAGIVFLGIAAVFYLAGPTTAASGLDLEPGDKIVILGNTLAERISYFPHFETVLHSRFAGHKLVVRNLGWSADELTLRPRSKDYQNHGHTLQDHGPDVVMAFFGFNESFAGKSGLAKFQKDLQNFVTTTTTTQYNGEHPPQLVLFSPIGHEDLQSRYLPDGKQTNQNLKLYTDAMRRIALRAAEAGSSVTFVDLLTPSLELYAQAEQPLTINGVHLTDQGYRLLAPVMANALFGPASGEVSERLSGPGYEKLHQEVQEKNLQHWYDYRAVNGFYIYGGRKKPFGVVNFPQEFAKLRKMVANRDQRIWKVAAGSSVPEVIDDSNSGELRPVKTNFKRKITITPPEEALKSFQLAPGFRAKLFASEVEFPELQNPCQFTFDAQGRLWVCTMNSYPMYLPGRPVDDKILILEDTDGDGRADKQIIFADKLHIPTGIELGDGGAYVAQQPNLMFLKDTDGDDRADERTLVLHGFDSADSHHSLSTFTWGPGGALYFQEGTFHHTQIETPYGPERVKNAAVFRFEPRTWKTDIFVSYGFANPWGHTFDRWGQNFVADASGGANYYGTAFSGDVDYPDKRARMKQFFRKQWRPTSGCEIVSSRNFPKEWQGDYLLNNVIGFQGVLHYRMKESGSGFAADPATPLIKSSDLSFRPVDLQFGPDGALYLCDWFNPLIGHMQHSLRDPNRDKSHGRIWRIEHTKNPLVTPPKIHGASVSELCELLQAYEDRTRYRVRGELRNRPTQEVMAALQRWTAELDEKGSNYWHHLLEALWVKQHHDIVDEALLTKLLRCPDYRARAAATRVLCYWRDRVENVFKLLAAQVNDEHPRVRLEAVRACSFFEGEQALKAQEIALESALYDQDDYLKYTFQETNKTLGKRIDRLTRK